MTATEEKLELIKWISNVDDTDVISYILAIRKIIESDSISKAEKASIIAGLSDADEGKFVSHA